MPHESRFRFCNKRVFLTYPQSGDISTETVRDFLRDTRGASWYTVALEQHEGGGNHIHAYAEWRERVDVRDERYFDVAGLHPNIQPVRNRTKCIGYVQKDGNYIGNVSVEGSTTTKYAALISESRGSEEFLAGAVELDPRRAIYGYQHLEYFAERKWGGVLETYTPEYTFSGDVLPADLVQYADEYLRPDTVSPNGVISLRLPAPLTSTQLISKPKVVSGRARSLVLIGASRTGKTEWARSHGDHMYFCGTWNWREWDDRARYVVFDDCAFSVFGAYWKAFLGCQKRFTINPKYGKRRTVLWGRPALWVCNPEGDPRRASGLGCDELEWLSINCVFVELEAPLFQIND